MPAGIASKGSKGSSLAGRSVVEECAAGRHAQCARSITIHPAHYPSSIDEPTPTGSLYSSRRYPPYLPHSTRWKFSGIIRDLRRGERAGTGTGIGAPPLPPSPRPPARAHLARFIRVQDEQRYLPARRQ